MDIVLELVDTFIADYIYARALPARPAASGFPRAASAANATAQAYSRWTYRPATKFMTVRPHAAAWDSAWTRDNPYRQLITLFFIVW